MHTFVAKSAAGPRSLKRGRGMALVLFLLALLSLTSCGVGKDRARFEGKLANITNAEFYAFSEDGAFEGVDTIRIEDGKFVYERKLTQPILLTLLYPNFTQTYVVLEPGKVIKMKGDAAKIGEAEISGTEQNELLTDFRQAQAAKPEADQRMAAAQFVENHAGTLAAVAVFRKYFANARTADVKTALRLLDALKKAQPKERAVTYLDEFYRPIFTNGVGELLPDFSAETLDGKTVTAADFRGKCLAIACIGTWQSESYPFLRKLRTRLNSTRGKWTCLIVSLDVDRNVLRDRLRTDTISYPVICDRQAFESPLVSKLGLHYVPSCMLVDATGKIVQRDVTKVEDLKLN